jgi:hypothetical protein
MINVSGGLFYNSNISVVFLQHSKCLHQVRNFEILKQLSAFYSLLIHTYSSNKLMMFCVTSSDAIFIEPNKEVEVLKQGTSFCK